MMDTMRPIGYRFHPTDEEYLRYYLHKKNLGHNDICCIIPEIDFCNWEPRELPEKFRESSQVVSDDPEWWFFCEQSQGQRVHRSTKEGHWKITGHDRKVMARVTKNLIGIKKTLVFHEGKGRKAKRTSWVMHEYHLPASDFSHETTSKFTLCRVKCKEHYEHDFNPSSDSQNNNHIATYFDDSVPLDDHSIPEDTVQATMAWLMEPPEPDASQFMSSGLEPLLDHSDKAKQPCSLEHDSPHSELHKKSSLDSLPDFIEDVQKKKKQTEDVKDFLKHSGQVKKSCSLEPHSSHSKFKDDWSFLESLPDIVEDVNDFLNEDHKTQFTQHLELDSKKETGLDSVDRGVLESTGEDKGIVIGQCDNILHNSCLVTDSPPTQSMEYFPIKQENICSSYLPKEGPSSTVPKKSRKIQDRIDMYNETESPAKIPRKKMETTPSTAATLQTTVGSWYANEDRPI